MSISSSEGSPLPLDLPIKYQKLAAEYAKVRSQVAVLKKGIVDEQNRSQDMKEQLKMKDQMIRKHDQELESLIFRNKQLTKRVTFLQEELETQVVDSLFKKANSKRGHAQQENHVTDDIKMFQEELQNRIRENAQLMSKLEEKEREHESENRSLKEKAESLEKSLIGVHSISNNTCCCEDLKKKISELESKLKERTLVNGKKSEKLISLQEIHPSFKELPFDDLISFISKLALSHRDLTANTILDLLKDLEIEIVCCERSFDEKVDTIAKLMTSLQNTSTNYISVHADGSDSDLIETVVAIQMKSRIIDKALSDLRTRSDRSTKKVPESNTHEPCKSCFSLSKVYDKKIDELNARILKLTEASKENVRRSENCLLSLESKNIQNEFGEALTNLEPEWSSDVVKEFVISKCSNALADVQLAESKLSRITSERDSTQSRLEHCLDVIQKRDSVVFRLEEELSVTSRSYIDQLNSMTEHMANLSDKLAAQQNKIEELTFQLTTQDSKKRKS